jgi:hypothetical protein
VWPWQRPYCRDFERCVDWAWAQAHETGIWWAHAYETETWVDWQEPEPIWFEQAPPDIEKCSRCMGFGSVVHKDWEMGPVYVDCQRCETTGLDPSLCPV